MFNDFCFFIRKTIHSYFISLINLGARHKLVTVGIDFDDFTTTQKAVYYDEKNWAGQYPLYSPVVDLEKEYHSDLEKITDAFALKFTFNTTVSTVDGNQAQVNVTIASDHKVECVISGTNIYFIWYEGFDFEDGAVSIYFDMDTADTSDSGDIG